MKAAVVAILCVGLSLSASAISEASSDGGADSSPWYLQQVVSYSEMDLVRFLGPVLLRGHQVARIYYQAACPAAGQRQVEFPRLAVARQPPDAVGLVAARAIFRNPRANVTADGSIIRIRLGNIPNDILTMRIPKLTFDQEAQYNEIDAINTIMNSREAEAEEARLGIHWPPTVIDHLVQEPMDGYPHMPAELADVTVDEALDKVATTFNVIIFYGINSCPTNRAFYVNYAMITPDMWRPNVSDIIDWLQIPRPYSVNSANVCKEVNDAYDCEFDVLNIDTDKPLRHVKVHAEWSDYGWKYTLLP